MRHHRVAVFVATILVASGFTPRASAQLPKLGPAQIGVWEGMWNIGGSGTSTLINPDRWQEITDASLIPRVVEGSTPTPREGWVLFWCRRQTVPQPPATYYGGPGETFAWNPALPAQIETLTLPAPHDDKSDLFCGSHVWRKDGKLFTGGGQAYFTPDFAHNKTALFDPLSGTWCFSGQASPCTSSLSFKRWYANSHVLSDDRVLVAGGDGQTTTSPLPEETHEKSPPGMTTSWTLMNNEPHVGDTGVCSTGGLEDIGSYATIFTLRNGTLGKFAPVNKAVFLNFGICGSGTPDRWIRAPAGAPAKNHFDSGSAHLIVVDPSDPSGFKEVVYILGGNEDVDVENLTTNVVEKMTNPDPNKAWDDAGAPDLLMTRAEFTALVLPDGSLLAVGGEGWSVPLQHTVPRKTPERYLPPEVFSGAPGIWTEMAEQFVAHEYHSVAGVLPDGRVFLAGGQPEAGWHVVEIYSPPYLFQGPRPTILGAPTSIDLSGGLTTISVSVGNLRPGANVDRVALLRPASVTHSVDFNQRYVELQFNIVPPTPSGGQTTVTLNEPLSYNYVPKGWYMLVAVDTNNIPSVMSHVLVK